MPFAAIAPFIGPGLGLLGSVMGGKQRSGAMSDAAGYAAQTGTPLSVLGPQSSAVYDQASGNYNLGLSGEMSGLMSRANTLGGNLLDRYATLTDPNNASMGISQEMSHMARARAPAIEQARSALQSQLLKRGRLGVGVGGGRGGRLFNPETAAQEEAILNAQMGDYHQARQQARITNQDLLSQATGLFGLGQNISQMPRGLAALGINARRPQNNLPNLAVQQGNLAASSTQGFFTGLGDAISGADFGSPGPASSHLDYYAPNGTGAR